MEKLLIVDDEEAMRRLLKINLEDRYEIIDTGTSTEALALAMREKPSAILLDLRMPKYSGFELCRTFSSMTATQLIPLIIVSGEAGATTELLCRELGAKAFFQKPVNFEALRERLADLLSTVRPERRGELRVRLRVRLKLRGTDVNNQPFEEVSATESVSQRGFLCGCTGLLKNDSTVDVFLVRGETKYVGTARVVRSEDLETPYPRYGFRFVQKEGDWILQ